jgi:predicted permease
VLKVEFQLPSARYVSASDRWPNIVGVHRFHAALLARSAAIPGVESAAIAASHPLNPGFTNSFVIVGREQESRDLPEMSIRSVTPHYFRTLRVKLLRGRFLDERDASDAPPVVVINDAAARRLFVDRDPVGQQIRFYGVTWTIAGVIGDEKIHGLGETTPIAAYTPIAQAPPRGGAVLLVRAAGDPVHLAAPLRSAFASIDPGLALFGIEPLAHTVAGSVSTERFLMVVLVLFAGLSLVLAAVGIYGVLNYTVAERTRELGIRLALGASPASVTHLVLGQGARLTLAGLAIGLVLAALFSRMLSGVLFGVTATDFWTFAMVVPALGGIALIATWIPVRRATRVDALVLFHSSR